MSNQPVFATPNFFDGTADHRMALRGRHVASTIRVSRQPLEEMHPLGRPPPRPAAGATGAAIGGRSVEALPGLAAGTAEDGRRLGPLRRAKLAASPFLRNGVDHLAAPRPTTRKRLLGGGRLAYCQREHFLRDGPCPAVARSQGGADARLLEPTAARRLVPLPRQVSAGPFREHGQRGLRVAGGHAVGIRPADRRSQGPSGRPPHARVYEAILRAAGGPGLGTVAAHARPVGLGLPGLGLCSRLRVDREGGVPGGGPPLGRLGPAVRLSLGPISDHALCHAARLRGHPMGRATGWACPSNGWAASMPTP